MDLGLVRRSILSRETGRHWSVAGRRLLSGGVSILFFLGLFWLLTASRLGSSLNWLHMFGGGLFLVLLIAGTFNVFLYLVVFLQEIGMGDSHDVLTVKGANQSGDRCTGTVRTYQGAVQTSHLWAKSTQPK